MRSALTCLPRSARGRRRAGHRLQIRARPPRVPSPASDRSAVCLVLPQAPELAVAALPTGSFPSVHASAPASGLRAPRSKAASPAPAASLPESASRPPRRVCEAALAPRPAPGTQRALDGRRVNGRRPARGAGRHGGRGQRSEAGRRPSRRVGGAADAGAVTAQCGPPGALGRADAASPAAPLPGPAPGLGFPHVPPGASPGAAAGAAGAGAGRRGPAARRPAAPRPAAVAPRPAGRRAAAAAARPAAAPSSPAPGPAAAARGPAGPRARRCRRGRGEPGRPRRRPHPRCRPRPPAPRPPWPPRPGLEPAPPSDGGSNVRHLGRAGDYECPAGQDTLEGDRNWSSRAVGGAWVGSAPSPLGQGQNGPYFPLPCH